jgi:hypothetical protein
MKIKKSESEVISVFQDISPALAEEYLAKNTHNRPVNKEHVKALAKAMREGRWQVTHQGIAFSEDLVLLDGQHRLLAIIESGVTVRMQVTMGMAKNALFGIDQNKVRTVAQNLGLMGHTYSKIVTAWSNVVKSLLTGGSERTWTTEDVKQIYAENYESIDRATVIHATPIRNGPVGAAYLIASPAHRDKVHEFFVKFLGGEGLVSGDPAYAAHKYYFCSPKRASDARWEVSAKLLRCAQAAVENERLEWSHVFVTEGALSYFEEFHPAKSVFGKLYAERRIIGKSAK